MPQNRFDDLNISLNHEWVVKYRIPGVEGFSARWAYPLTLAYPSDSILNRGIILPSNEEVALLAAYADYRLHRWYDDNYIKRVIRNQVLDLDPGVNTHHFGKDESIGWQYHTMTWRHGPVPFKYDANDTRRFPNLIDLLNYIEGSYSENKGWDTWKEENASHIKAASS